MFSGVRFKRLSDLLFGKLIVVWITEVRKVFFTLEPWLRVK